MLLKWYDIQRRRLLSNAGTVRLVRGSKLSTWCYIPAGQSFYSQYKRCSLFNEMKWKSWIERYGPAALQEKSPHITSLAFFFWYSLRMKYFRLLCPSYRNLNKAIWQQSKLELVEALKTFRMNFENLLPAFIQDSGGFVEDRWSSTRTASVERCCDTK